MDRADEIRQRLVELREKESNQAVIVEVETVKLETITAECRELTQELEQIERRRRLTLIKGGGAGVLVAGVVGFARRYPRAAVLTAASTVAATGVATTVLALASSPPTRIESEPPPSAVVKAVRSVSPSPVRSSPSAVVSTGSPTLSVPGAAPSTQPGPASSATAPTAVPVGVVPSLVLPSLPVSLPASLPSLPSLPVPSRLVPSTLLPSPTASGTPCVVNLDLRPVIGVCVL